MLKLKTTILPSEEPPDEAKNEERYAELIQFLDNKGLPLVMRDAADDSRKALKILGEHYASQSNPRIITLYTEFDIAWNGNKQDSYSVLDYDWKGNHGSQKRQGNPQRWINESYDP